MTDPKPTPVSEGSFKPIKEGNLSSRKNSCMSNTVKDDATRASELLNLVLRKKRN